MDELKEFHIAEDSFVTITKMNHIIEIQYLEKRNNRINLKKINDEEYIVLSTGEIKEYSKGSSRYDCTNSLRRTFKNLRYLINNNFVGAANELFVTLTYAENMQDEKRLYSDVKNFIKRLKYHYKDLSKIEYINVVEPQGRGAWHCHILLKFIDVNSIYIPNKLMAEIWPYGFVNVRGLKNMSIDNIGAYLTAYLADIPLNDFEAKNLNSSYSIKDIDGKKYVKGGRLILYPKGMNLYRCSKGIKKPKRKIMKYFEAKKYVSGATLTYTGTKNIQIDDFNNTIIYEYYNLKRLKIKVE